MSIRVTTHPGVFIKAEFVDELKLNQTELASAVGVARSTLARLFSGKSDLTPELAIKLSDVLGTVNPETWMRMQAKHDLTKAQTGTLKTWKPNARLRNGRLVAVTKTKPQKTPAIKKKRGRATVSTL